MVRQSLVHSVHFAHFVLHVLLLRHDAAPAHQLGNTSLQSVDLHLQLRDGAFELEPGVSALEMLASQDLVKFLLLLNLVFVVDDLDVVLLNFFFVLLLDALPLKLPLPDFFE